MRELSLEDLGSLEMKYSVGTSSIVSTLLPLLSAPNFEYDSILINLETILRNVYSKDKTVKELVNDTIKEYADFIGEILDVIESNTSIKSLYMLVYIGDHIHNLPYRSRKKETQKRLVMQEAVSKLEKKGSLFIKRKIGKVNFEGLVLTTMRRVARQLAWKVNAFLGANKILMLSHMPLDFHIFQQHPQSAIIESYTGKILKYSPIVFGQKVFKLDNVPFTGYTHALLGDGITVSLIKDHKTKKKILELADKKAWKFASREGVNRDILEAGLVPPFIPM